jgi:hypothetical protein
VQSKGEAILTGHIYKVYNSVASSSVTPSHNSTYKLVHCTSRCNLHNILQKAITIHVLFFQNAGTSKQGSSTFCESLDVSLEQHQMPNTVNLPASSAETSSNAGRISPVPSTSHTSPSILPCASSSCNNQIQHAMGDSAVSLQRTQKKYTYKKLSELMEPNKRVNIYGVIDTITKVKLILNVAYIVCSY